MMMKKITITTVFFIFFTNITFSSLKKEKIIFIGDSLTAGYGIEKKKSFPNLIFEQIKKQYPNIEIVNAGISGSTTASGKQRLEWLLKSELTTKLMILALGANDGLRGKDISQIEKNLSTTIELAQSKKIKILLCGMKIPDNYGKKYSDNFEIIFKKVAQKYKIQLVPFLLKDVAGKKDLNLKDGIHPNEKGHEIIAKNLLPYILKLLK